MARGKIGKQEVAEKKISLTVIPQSAGSQDIHVEVKRGLSAKKSRNQRRFAAFLFAVVFLMLFPIARDVIAYMQMSGEYEGLRLRNEELVTANEQLEAERDALYSPEMVERLAREELDLVMPGESKLYRTIPTEDIPKRIDPRTGAAVR